MPYETNSLPISNLSHPAFRCTGSGFL